MKFMVIGSGAREYMIARSLYEEGNEIICVPGNGDLPSSARKKVSIEDMQGLLALAREEQVDFTIVGPEKPLEQGIVNLFTNAGQKILGPTALAARLETRKDWCRLFLRRHGISQMGFAIFDDPVSAKAYVRQQGAPIVIKAAGLAAGKGSYVVFDLQEAFAVIDKIMVAKVHGNAGKWVVIEEHLPGQELSVVALVDGDDLKVFPVAQDYKRAWARDPRDPKSKEGPNTGGMGAYAPVPVVTPELMGRIKREILEPILEGMAKESRPYRGVLYPGLVLLPNDRLEVYEVNCRFGDPEIVAQLALLESSFTDMICATADGALASLTPQWSSGKAVCVVLASKGYPNGELSLGHPVSGIERAREKGIMVCHAGTEENKGQLVNTGGRVLGLAATASTFSVARELVYTGVREISFSGCWSRDDIAAEVADD